MIKPAAAVAGLRARRPFLDHLVRSVGRYQADTGDRLAAAVTFYWFLSLFPLLLVAIWLFSLVVGDRAVQEVQDALGGYLPKQLVDTIGNVVANSANKAGVIGIVGLVLSGLGWIDALREAIRTVWHQNVKAGNIVTRKLHDVVALVGLFATIAASVFVTGLAGSGPQWLLEQLGVDQTTAAVWFTKALGLVLTGLADVALFTYLFVRLARVRTPVREVLKGAVFGAVGFGVLKLVGGYYVQRTTTKGEATYGTFAVVVGLLLFLNLVSRLFLLSAAFVVTGPYDSDTRPSGTADPEQARKAGIPEEYADTDLNLQEDGAPSPLRAVLQGELPPQDEPEGREPAGAASARPAVAAQPVGAAQVQLAARATAAAGGAVLLAVAVHALRTFLRLLRR